MLLETFSNFSQQSKQNTLLQDQTIKFQSVKYIRINEKEFKPPTPQPNPQPKQAKHFSTTQKQKEIQATKLTYLSPTGIFTEYGCSRPPSPTTDSETSGELADALTAERRLLLPERSERKLHLREAARRGEGGKKRELERRK